MTATEPVAPVELVEDAQTPIVEPEPAPVEIVDKPPAAGAIEKAPEPSALERAANELMATPGAPGRDEFLVLATTARILSLSRGAPKEVRDDPWLAFHLALIGRDLGISPSAAIAQIDVIGSGESAQLSISPELLNAQIKRLGLGSIVPAASSDTACTAIALLPHGRVDPRCARSWPDHTTDERRPCVCTFDLILGEHTFTWANAQTAGIANPGCEGPDSHTDLCRTGGNGSTGKRCHQGYRTYPKRMMWWRAAGYVAADYFPEASVGLYSPEELGAVVDPDTGRPYDPATVELPEGYNPPEKPHDPMDDPVFEVDPDTKKPVPVIEEGVDLLKRVEAIKTASPDAAAALKELWEATREDESRLTPPIAHLRRRHLVRARAITKQIEDRIKRAKDWGDEVKAAWVDASMEGNGFGAGRTPAQEPEAAPSQPEGSDTAPDASEASTGDQGGAGEATQETFEVDDDRKPIDDPVPDPPTDEQIMEQAIADVRAMKPTEVTLALGDRKVEPVGNVQNQRQQLALLVYLERGGTPPAAE